MTDYELFLQKKNHIEYSENTIDEDLYDLPNFTVGSIKTKKEGSATNKVIPQKSIQFVFTGVMDDLNRVAAEDYVKERGGKVGVAVSRKTNYLVKGFLLEDGRPTTSGTKWREATKWHVTILEGKVDFLRVVDELVSGNIPFPDVRVNSAKNVRKIISNEKKKFVVKAAISMASSSSVSRLKREKDEANNQLWVEKYKPTSIKDILGSAEIGKKLGTWLSTWTVMHMGPVASRLKPDFSKDNPGARAVLISGPPGIGKSTIAALIAREQGFEVYELNASDTRSRRFLSDNLSDVVGSSVISGTAMRAGTKAKRVIIMDEVDGLSGNADRGGSQELIKLIKTSSTPIICICNDRQSNKVKALANSCFDLRMKRPMKTTIARRVAAIARSEGLNIEDSAVELLAESCGNDIRQCLNALQFWTTTSSNNKTTAEATATYEDMKDRLNFINKDAMQRFSAFDGARMILSETKTKSHFDRCDAYFIDHSLAPLLLQQNYVTAATANRVGNMLAKLDRIDAAAECLSDVDLIGAQIGQQQYWGLLTTQASLCVRVGVLADGSCMNPTFPAWFGKNSSAGKHKRLADEFAVHVSHRTSGTRDSIRLEYMETIRKYVSAPLLRDGVAGVEETIRRLDEYGLSRDDLLDTLHEFALMKDDEPGVDNLDTKTKSAFTRAYNGTTHSSQSLYQSVASKKKRAKNRTDDDDEDDDDEVNEEEEIAKIFAKNKRPPAKSKGSSVTKKSHENANKTPASKKNPVE